MEKTEIIPIKFKEAKGSSFRAPIGTSQFIDEFLAKIEEVKGIRFSRNSYILKSISFFSDYLMQSPDMEEIVKRIYTVNE